MNVLHVRLLTSLGCAVLALALTLIYAPPDAGLADGPADVVVTAVDQSVRVIVLGSDGRPDEIWSNTSTAPDVVVFRTGAVNGPDVVPGADQVDSYRSLDAAIDWGRRGLVWKRLPD